MDVNDSDHKPVRCLLDISVARIDEVARRQQFGEILSSCDKIKSLFMELCTIPETHISTGNIFLQNQNTSILHITNTSESEAALFEIYCEGHTLLNEEGVTSVCHSRGSFGLPHWLEVTPVYGIVKPECTAEVTMRHEDTRTLEDLVDGKTQNWNEESKDKEATLVVNIMGLFSTRAKNHHVTVHLSMPFKLKVKDPSSFAPKEFTPVVMDRKPCTNTVANPSDTIRNQ